LGKVQSVGKENKEKKKEEEVEEGEVGRKCEGREGALSNLPHYILYKLKPTSYIYLDFHPPPASLLASSLSILFFIFLFFSFLSDPSPPTDLTPPSPFPTLVWSPSHL
jgi:hypothetical protein